MPEIIKQVLVKMYLLIVRFVDMIESVPVLNRLQLLDPPQILSIFLIASFLIALLLSIILIYIVQKITMGIRKRAVKHFFAISDLKKFDVWNMARQKRKYYSDEGINMFRLAIPKWKHSSIDGKRDKKYLINKVIRPESILWLQARKKTYVLCTKDPREMIYLVHELRSSGVAIEACVQEMEKQEQINNARPTTEDVIQELIARMDGDKTQFANLCRERLSVQGYKTGDAPHNSFGIEFTLYKKHYPSAVKCHLVPHRELLGLDFIRQFKTAAQDELFVDNCTLVTTGGITIAAANYAKSNGVDIIWNEHLVKLLDTDDSIDPSKGFLKWEYTVDDLQKQIPDDIKLN